MKENGSNYFLVRGQKYENATLLLRSLLIYLRKTEQTFSLRTCCFLRIAIARNARNLKMSVGKEVEVQCGDWE